jgi:KaiC/GvpD/RAD55 family RecA-like ATPase
VREILISEDPGAGKTLLLMKLMKEFDNVVWVTTTRSAKSLRKILKSDNVWIIDAYSGTRVKFHPRDLVINNPFNLNELRMAIFQVIDQIKEEMIVIFDSITGLLIYYGLREIIRFISSLFAKVEERQASSIFTLVKNAHDLHTIMNIYAIFPTVIELLREDNNEIRRFIRIIRALEDVEPNFGEIKIVKDDIILPDCIMDYIMRILKY